MIEPPALISTDHLLPSELEDIRRTLARFVPAQTRATDDFRELLAARDPRELITATAKAARAARIATRDGNPAQHVTAEEAIAALRLSPTVHDALRTDELALLEAARDAGVSWSKLGDELGGRSRQAVQQWYRRLGGNRSWPESRENPPVPGSRDPREDDRGWLPDITEWQPDYTAEKALTEGITIGLNAFGEQHDCPPLRWSFVYGLDPEDAPSRFFLEGFLADDAALHLDPDEQADELEGWIRALRLTERPDQYVREGRQWWGYVHATPAVIRTIHG